MGLVPADVLRLNWRIYNASVTVLNYRRSGLALVSFNETAYLSLACPELITLRDIGSAGAPGGGIHHCLVGNVSAAIRTPTSFDTCIDWV